MKLIGTRTRAKMSDETIIPDTPAASTPAVHRRPLITPERLVVLMILLEVLLILSERFHWFAFNDHKGWTVLIALASVVMMLGLMVLAFIASLLVRRPLRFSLRALLWMVVAIAIPCSWLRAAVAEAEREQTAVEAIQKAGGQVRFKDTMAEKEEVAPPEFLVDQFGSPFFYEVIEVGLDGLPDDRLRQLEPFLALLPRIKDVSLQYSSISEAGLQVVAGLGQLERANLGGTPITDSNLANLRALKKLRSLALYNTAIRGDGIEALSNLEDLRDLDFTSGCLTDEGLAHVATLTRLEKLNLKWTHVTDDGLVALEKLNELRNLSLDHTAVTDAGLQHLRGLSNLEELELKNTIIDGEGFSFLQRLRLKIVYLDNTQFNDVGLRFLQAQTELGVLFLSGTKITGAGLASIKSLKQLEYLALDGDRIADADIEQLRGMTQLRILLIRGTPLSGKSIELLRQALPGCMIWPRANGP